MGIKIDKIDRRILYELDRNCRIPDSQLAKIVNRSRESVRLRIAKLQKEGIIQGFITSINPSKFGYMMFKLYFQLVNDPEERKKVFDYLKGLKGMYWFGTNDGVWDMHMTLYARSVEDFNNLKNEIFTNLRNSIIKRDVGVLVCTRQYPKKYIVDKLNNDEFVYFAGTIEHNEIDELDNKILNNLIQNGRISLVQLAGKIGSSVDIIRNRMRKLEEKGIITQYRIAVDHNKLGYTMFKAFLYFDNLSESDRSRFLEFAKMHKNIIYVVEQLSAWDFELEIIADNYMQFTNLMNEIKLMFKDSMKNYEFALMREDIWALKEI